jgi:hypothetical protein
MSMSRRDAKRIDRALQKGEQIISPVESLDPDLEYEPNETENESYTSGSWEAWDPDEEVYDLETIGSAAEGLEVIYQDSYEG